jgi:hypothetical protein
MVVEGSGSSSSASPTAMVDQLQQSELEYQLQPPRRTSLAAGAALPGPPTIPLPSLPSYPARPSSTASSAAKKGAGFQWIDLGERMSLQTYRSSKLSKFG